MKSRYNSGHKHLKCMAQSLFGTFGEASVKNWTEAAKKELGGKDPFDALALTKGGLAIKPYYDQSDTLAITEDNLRPSLDPYLGPRGWHNVPDITVKDCAAANKLALWHLNNGADGVQFTLDTKTDMAKLLHQMELTACSIFFVPKNGRSTLLGEFEQYVHAKGFDKTKIVGGIFCQPPEGAGGTTGQGLEDWGNFHALGHMVQPAGPTDEIASALLLGVSMAGTMESPLPAISHLAFSFSIGPDFFLEIAKLRAFRRLWYQVCHAYGATSGQAYVHGLSHSWDKESFQPNANMLKSTSAALSAILGGCDAITIKPEDDSPLKVRIARDVLTILREESHLNRTADAVAGAFYLESLTNQMAKTAWAKFQQTTNA